MRSGRRDGEACSRYHVKTTTVKGSTRIHPEPQVSCLYMHVAVPAIQSPEHIRYRRLNTTQSKLIANTSSSVNSQLLFFHLVILFL